MTNTNYNKAKLNKDDEFYTNYNDIEQELSHYKNLLKDQIVYCNCDDYQVSNFVKYFINNFESFHLKKLIATNYSGLHEYYQLSLFEEIVDPHVPYYFEYDGTNTIIKRLKHTGDFKSVECIEILKGADIVITNPPFSLMRTFVKMMFKYNKQFLIIAPSGLITYENFFTYFKDGILKLGFTKPKSFIKDDKNVNVPSAWYTTLNIKVNKPFIKLTKTYNPTTYPKYDNYDAIEVSDYRNIPCDYAGYMGVPISFLDHYNPDQFELIGITNTKGEAGIPCTKMYYDDEWIELNQSEEKTNRNISRHNGYPFLKGVGDGCYNYNAKANEYNKVCYVRLIIRRRGI